MITAACFTNITNFTDCQQRLRDDFGCERSVEWLKFFPDCSLSQDSNDSTKTTSTSDPSDEVMKLHKGKPSKNGTDRELLLQTPQKITKIFSPDYERVTPRKPMKPTKSVNSSDPSFRGVTLQMKTNIKRSKHDMETQLVIRSYFTAKKKRSPNDKPHCPPGGKTRLVPSSLDIRFQQTGAGGNFDSEELKENFGELGCRPFSATPVKMSKECTSCGTLKTPLWRDAEDGTPLCNACGIRYKKYRIRCPRCWYIPKKEDKASIRCTSCSSYFDKLPTKRKTVFY